MSIINGHQEDSAGNILLPTPHSLVDNIELGNVATRPYTTGEFLVFNDHLCKTIKPIATNAAFVIHQNIEPTTVSEQLNKRSANHRKFVLIGDSFGCGIIGDGSPWVDGWINYFAKLFPGRVFYYDPKNDPTFSGNAGFTNNSEVRFLNQLNYVYTDKLGTTDPSEITDVVVLGGTNETIDQTVETITNAITEFCNRSKEIFPNAQISIGIVGLHARRMVYELHTYDGYKYGAVTNGAIFLEDCINLGCLHKHDSGYNHWTSDGYACNNPYIAQMILNGHTHYCLRDSYKNLPIVESDVEFEQDVLFTFNMDVYVYEDHLMFELYADQGYMPGFINTKVKAAPQTSTRVGKMLRLPMSVLDYPYILGADIWEASYYWTNHGNSPVFAGSAVLRIMVESGVFYITYMLAHPFTGPEQVSNIYVSTITWPKNSKPVPVHMDMT